jgi:hypothetical protein
MDPRTGMEPLLGKYSTSDRNGLEPAKPVLSMPALDRIFVETCQPFMEIPISNIELEWIGYRFNEIAWSKGLLRSDEKVKIKWDSILGKLTYQVFQIVD